MTKTVKNLIETYIHEIEKDNYINVIAEAANYGFDYVTELRSVLVEAEIIIKPFDEQLAKMLTTYKEIIKLIQ